VLLHNDSITLAKSGLKVLFRPFVGVGPRKYFDLFSMTLGSGRTVWRKHKDGTVTKVRDKSRSELRIPLDPKSYIEREEFIIKQLLTLISNSSGVQT